MIFCTHSYHLVFFLCPIIWQLSKNILFQKMGAKIGFFKFLCFKLIFGKFSFLGLLKHYKNRGFSRCLCFFVFEKEKKATKKMITGISEFGFFLSKNGRFVTHNFFPKKQAEAPIFIVFLGARFLGQGVKKGNFWIPCQKERKC